MAIPQDLPQEQRRARFQSLRNQAAERIAGTLDPERRAKYAEIRRAQSGGATATAATGRVFVIGGDGKPKSVDLRLGIGDGQFTELLSGDLKAGQDVIVGGGDRPAQGSSGGPRLGF